MPYSVNFKEVERTGVPTNAPNWQAKSVEPSLWSRVTIYKVVMESLGK